MATAHRQIKTNGYGDKQTVRVITVDKEKRRIECATRDGAMIFVAVWETGAVFRWPEVGEIWTVRSDTGIWRLDQQVQSEIAEDESEATALTLEELDEGDTRIDGNTVWVNNLTITGEIDGGGLPKGVVDWGLVSVAELEALEPGLGDRALLSQPSPGLIWELVADGDPSESGYQWAVLGSPQLRQVETATKSTSSVTPQTSGAPSITAPIAMLAEYEAGCADAGSGPTSGNAMKVGLHIDGEHTGIPGDSQTDHEFGGGSIHAPHGPFPIDKGKVAQARYWSSNGQSSNFAGLYIHVLPLRVG